MPGHYTQIWHSNKYPSVLRAVLGSGPFIEGWACYAEDVMADAGYLDGDHLYKIVHLKLDLRSTVNAIIDQANPSNMLRRYAAIAAATKDILRTDIPKDLLKPFVDLALKIKDAKVRSVVFRYTTDLSPDDPNYFNPADPDFTWVHHTVAKSIGEAPTSPHKHKKKKPDVAADAEDACAYNPVAAP